MLFQWISIHTGLRTWKHKINQRFWALGVPWSPGFVLGLPLEVVLKNNPSDHETWSIRCHVGIQVDFTSILHSHTPLVPQAECEVNLDRLHLLHQWECSKSKGRGLSVSCVKWPSHSHRCPNMVYFFVPFLCDYSLDLFNVVVCFVPLQPQDPENVAPTFFYLFVELERSMWPMRSCGFPYFCRSISSEPFLRKIIGLPDGLKGGVLESPHLLLELVLICSYLLFSMLPTAQGKPMINIEILAHPNPMDWRSTNHQHIKNVLKCALDCNAVANSLILLLSQLGLTQIFNILVQSKKWKPLIITKWMTLSWATPLPYHMAYKVNTLMTDNLSISA